MSDALLVATGLTRSFPSGAARIEVLRGVDLTVDSSRTLAVVGMSGAGKSTLLHQLGGLDRPDAGSVRHRGVEIARLSAEGRADHRNREVGFVFQFHYLLPEFTAVENVEMPFRIAGKAGGGSRARSLELLDRLGLARRADHHPGELSGGEQQRVAIARALAMGPSLVLADEPTGNLDRATGNDVFELLRALQREHGFALVLATHSEALARACGDIHKLEDGRLRPLDDRETQEYFDGLGAKATPGPML